MMLLPSQPPLPPHPSYLYIHPSYIDSLESIYASCLHRALCLLTNLRALEEYLECTEDIPSPRQPQSIPSSQPKLNQHLRLGTNFISYAKSQEVKAVILI